MALGGDSAGFKDESEALLKLLLNRQVLIVLDRFRAGPLGSAAGRQTIPWMPASTFSRYFAGAAESLEASNSIKRRRWVFHLVRLTRANSPDLTLLRFLGSALVPGLPTGMRALRLRVPQSPRFCAWSTVSLLH